MDNFKVIAFTPEIPRKDEVKWIECLLTHSSQIISRVHVRHPGFDIRPLIESLPENLLPYISVHDQIDLLVDYPSLGFHFNSRVPYAEIPGNGLRSRSCHSISELENLPKLDYVTLSPIFNSICKPGYNGKSEFLLNKFNTNVPVFALSGITPVNLLQLRGFAGAAMLGAINVPMEKLDSILQEIRQNVDYLCSSL